MKRRLSLPGLSVMDVVTVDNDVITLETLFKGWLQDCGTDVEHLHILLPGGEGEGEEVIIKCDLHERVLNPSSMTLNHFVSPLILFFVDHRCPDCMYYA